MPAERTMTKMMNEKEKEKEKEEVEHRYFLRRPNGTESVVAGTQKKAIEEARYLATHQNETVMVFMLVGSVSPPEFKQDEYEPL